VAAVVLLFRLGDPPGRRQRPDNAPTYVHDECYQAFTAHRYLLGDPNAWNPLATRQDAEAFFRGDMTAWTSYEWVHPPTAKLVMAGFIRVLGFTPFAYRLSSVVFGLLTLLVLWRLARRMRGPGFGLLALVLLAADGMWFVFSRVAMNDIYVTGCVTAAMYAVYRYWTGERGRLAWLVASGGLFSLGLTMKWNAGPLLLGMAAITLGRLVYEERTGTCRGRALVSHTAAWLVGFVIAPPAVYLLSYAPYFLAGHGLSDLVELHRQIWHYHSSLKATHSQASRWWEWPLMTQPVWLYLHQTARSSRVIYALGNPLLWWFFLPGLVHVAIRFIQRRQPADGLILCGFLGAWLPWAFVGRVAFIQYLLPGVPFGVLAVATLLQDTAEAAGRRRVLVCGAAAALCVAVFIHFYPILSAWPVTPRSLAGRQWFWFEQWRGH